jgi:short subunit fatty acids transporter
MKFNYQLFDVMPYLEQKKQPVIVVSDLEAHRRYYSLSDPETGAFTKTASFSDAARVPVFAIKIKSELKFSVPVGVSMFAASIPIISRFLNKIRLEGQVSSMTVVLGKNFHQLDEQTYRVYLGLLIKV